MKKLSTMTVLLALGVNACDGTRSDLSTQERETQARAHMESLRGDPAALGAFVRDMPKGGDLHSHTSGAITMEKLIQWGSEDGACVNTTTWVASNPCAADSVPMSRTAQDPVLYNSVLGAWSMEGYTGPLLDAHQHFFDAFGKYGAVQLDSRGDDIYADILSRAGQQHQIYVELMQGFGASTGGRLAASVFSATDAWDKATLLARREQLVALPAFQSALDAQVVSIAGFIKGARELMRCGTPQADAGCDVELRLISSANRTGDRVNVFGQWVFASELVQRVPELVGTNLVSPEENDNSLKYYDDDMFALGVLDDFNDQQPGRKQVHISLHAGELIPAVLKSADQEHLRFHIRSAVEKAHAERIGHGVDVLGETAGAGAADLLNDMREMGVLVEICLTSNRVLLGASSTQHPLGAYLQQHVPVTLATDDQGILRNDISTEYFVAATDQGLDYLTLKQLARASLEHAFVEGDSLWARRDDFSASVAACSASEPGAGIVSAECQKFLTTHHKANLQWKLEAQLIAFEERFAQ
jgi:adenosine deaminase